MKIKRFLLIFVVFTFNLLIGCKATSLSATKDTSSQSDKAYFGVVKLDERQIPTDYELSVINFILKNTQEINIHKMRGEKNNKVYLHKDEQKEAVFDKNGNVVTNYNAGSYNYYAYTQYPIKHFNHDMLPWLMMGSTPDDVTSKKERLYYYTLDLSYGIQSYIFAEKPSLTKVSFKSLNDTEKDTYRLFKKIIFNEDYQYKLSTHTKAKFKASAKDYWAYFAQIQDFLKVKQ